jgi:hypothetical protein
MRRCVYTLYRAARYLSGLPPEVLGAAVLAVLERPDPIVVLAAIAPFVLKYIAGVIISGILTWYLKSILEIHLWPRLPSEHKRALLRIRDRALLKAPHQNRPVAPDDESAFSRNSKRHPHW